MVDNEKSTYEVSLPIYQFHTTARISTDSKSSKDMDKSEFLDDLELFEDFNAIRFETSHIHLNSALFFADEGRRIENFMGDEETQDDDEPDMRIDARVPIGNRHDMFIVYSVISTVSFLESLINEFYERHLRIAKDETDETFEEELKKDHNVANPRFYRTLKNLEEVENRDFEYNSVLKKYQYLLMYADEDVFDKGKEPFQSVALVRALRNKLVHAETEWIDLENSDSFSIGKSLNGKFALNPLTENLPLYRQYFSFDCAKWCIESSFEFALEFYERMRTKPPKHIRERKSDLWNPESIIKVEEKEG